MTLEGEVPMSRSTLFPAIQLSVRAALAALLSVVITRYVGLDARQALITAILVIDLSPAETRRLALPRLGGTVLGGLIGASFGTLLPASAMTLGLGVLTAMFTSHLVRLQRAARLAGFICGIILLHQTQTPWTYASHRFLETTLGIVMAVLTSFLPKLIPTGHFFPDSRGKA